MFKYKLTLAYDGATFAGWQVQANAESIQYIIQKALSTILRLPAHVTGSGRTDAGVHAKGQVAHFTSSTPIDQSRVLHSLNGLLPLEIRALQLEEAPNDFHARYSAKGKIYHYHIHLDRILDPFKKGYAAHIPQKIDLEELKKATTHFIGTHDFTSFANEADTGSAARDAVRTIHRLDVIEEPGGIRLEFEGDGFLYKMVRNITGTLVDVGAGRFSAGDIPNMLQARNRKEAGATAPACGLFLIKVYY